MSVHLQRAARHELESKAFGKDVASIFPGKASQKHLCRDFPERLTRIPICGYLGPKHRLIVAVPDYCKVPWDLQLPSTNNFECASRLECRRNHNRIRTAAVIQKPCK